MDLRTEGERDVYFREQAAQRMIDEMASTFTLPAKRLCDIAVQLRALPYGDESFQQKMDKLNELMISWENTAKDFIAKGEIIKANTNARIHNRRIYLGRVGDADLAILPLRSTITGKSFSWFPSTVDSFQNLLDSEVEILLQHFGQGLPEGVRAKTKRSILQSFIGLGPQIMDRAHMEFSPTSPPTMSSTRGDSVDSHVGPGKSGSEGADNFESNNAPIQDENSNQVPEEVTGLGQHNQNWAFPTLDDQSHANPQQQLQHQRPPSLGNRSGQDLAQHPQHWYPSLPDNQSGQGLTLQPQDWSFPSLSNQMNLYNQLYDLDNVASTQPIQNSPANPQGSGEPDPAWPWPI